MSTDSGQSTLVNNSPNSNTNAFENDKSPDSPIEPQSLAEPGGKLHCTNLGRNTMLSAVTSAYDPTGGAATRESAELPSTVYASELAGSPVEDNRLSYQRYSGIGEGGNQRFQAFQPDPNSEPQGTNTVLKVYRIESC